MTHPNIDDLEIARRGEAININPQQIKTTSNWQNACYASDLHQELKIISKNLKCNESLDR
jgi:hypothetical protein